MTAALLLLAYALVMSTAGSWLLVRSRWLYRSPRLGVVIWHVASFSVLAVVGLAGLVLLWPDARLSSAVARIAHACAPALDAVYAIPGVRIARVAVGAALLATLVRAAVYLARTLWTASQERTRLARMLSVVSAVDPALNALVLDHESVAVYCLPGRGGGKVVFTSAALAVLGLPERQAVLAHEQAHLRQRHHVVLAVASALRSAFPKVPLLRVAEEEIATLVEMVADDVSVRRCDRRAVASALRAFSASADAPDRVTSSASSLDCRLHRLHAPVQPPQRVALLAARGLVVAAALMLPLVLAAPQTTLAMGAVLCPATSDTAAPAA